MRMILVLCTLFLGLTESSYCQEKTFSDLQGAIDSSLMMLKRDVGHYDHIFLVGKFDENMQLPANAFKIENSVNAKVLNKGDKDYLVEVVINSKENYFGGEFVVYKVEKLTRKKIKLTNLSRGFKFAIK